MTASFDCRIFLPKKPLPGVPDQKAMLRVDLAGEQSAVAIYEGQLCVLGKSDGDLRENLEEMLAHEKIHEATLGEWVQKEAARPSFLTFLWRFMGYRLGWLAGKLGASYAMAQTEAVESVIEKHYGAQVSALEPGPLKTLLARFQEEEQHHEHTGKEFHPGGLKIELWMCVTKAWTHAAVWIATRL